MKMESLTSRALTKSLNKTEVPVWSDVILNCGSNDNFTNFMAWLLDTNEVIGPGNNYDERKYKYEVLSGNLHINSVSQIETGKYKCLSKELGGSGIFVGEVEMVVMGSTTVIEAMKLLAIVLSILVIISCAVIYYRLRREWNKYDGRSIVPVDDEEEDVEGEEIYNRTTTTITPVSQPVAGPSRNQSSEHLIYGIDNQGLDTDFNSVFENIQIKSPDSSLI